MHTSSLVVGPVLSERRYRGAYQAHEHRHAQVLLGLEGALELDVAGRAACIDASSALVIPAGVSHAFASEGGARLHVVDAPPGAALDRVRTVRLRELGSTPTDALACLALVEASPRGLPRRVVDPRRLVAALEGRLHERWPTARLAAVFALSTAQFHARWTASSGETPQGWLRARRLDRAERSLRRGRSLESTALEVGYASASALGEALRRERGGSARVLRARERSGR